MRKLPIRNGLTLLGAAFLMTACATTSTTHRPGQDTSVIAHRGASAYAPENTLVAFQAAAEMNAPWFELDCTLSADGDVIVIHDDTLERTTPLTGRVMETSTTDMIAADAGTWFHPKFANEKVPTLDQVLDFAKDTIGVYIEIKDSHNDRALRDDLLAYAEGTTPLIPKDNAEVMRRIEASGTANLPLTRKVIQLVRERQMENEIVIQSFSPIVCAIALIEAPDLRTELLASSNADRPSQWRDFQRWVRLIDAHGFNINKDLATRTIINQMHDEGRTVAIWTVNDEADMRRLSDLGADFLITDKPDVALDVLAD